MFGFRTAALVRLFAERCERHATVLATQEQISLALQAQTRGEGRGPSDALFDRLAVAMAASEHADTCYLRMLAQVADEIIASAKASARTRG